MKELRTNAGVFILWPRQDIVGDAEYWTAATKQQKIRFYAHFNRMKEAKKKQHGYK